MTCRRAAGDGTSRRQGSRPAWAALGALASIALLTGCGRSPAGGAQGAVAVRLAFFPNVTHAVALVGTGRGAFARALGPGAKLEELVFNAGPAEITALFGDQVDIGYIGPGPAVNGYLKSGGRALRIVAGASSGGAALVVRKDAGIIDVRGLAGKRIAVPQVAGTQDISMRHALREAALESTDKGGTVSVMPTENPNTLSLFVQKQLDAAWVPEPWVARLLKEGNGGILKDERDLWPGRRFATTLVIVRAQFLREHPDLVRRLLAAHVETVDWMRAHPDDARRVVGERIKQLTTEAIPADVLADAWARTDFTYDPMRESVLTFADRAQALGYQKEGRGGLAALFDLSALNRALETRKLPTVQ